jgi:hypothetical protein
MRIDADTGELRPRTYAEWAADEERRKWAAMTPAQQRAVQEVEVRCRAVDKAFAEEKRRRGSFVAAFEPEWLPQSEMGPRQKI